MRRCRNACDCDRRAFWAESFLGQVDFSGCIVHTSQVTLQQFVPRGDEADWHFLLNSAKVVMQDTWLESGQDNDNGNDNNKDNDNGNNNLLLNSAKVVRVVMQDTWLESGQAAMCRSGDKLFGQSSQT